MTLDLRVERALRVLGVRDSDPVGVACSGGADSIALLHLLHRTDAHFDLVVLHVDHGMRPDSGAHAEFVSETAHRLGLDVHVLKVDVDVSGRTGPEAAARAARYSALDEAAAELALRWVATAHTLDDQAETVLLRTIRGGSLASIHPRRGVIVRPLLQIERHELRTWLVAHDIPWLQDPTNTDLRLERNWIRSDILPLLRERRPGVANVMARLAANVRHDEKALDDLAAAAFERAEIDEAGVLLPSTDLDGLPQAITTRLVRMALRHAGIDPSWSDLDAIDALGVGERTSCGATSVWRLPAGLAVMREPPPVPASIDLPGAGLVEASEWGVRVRVGVSVSAPWTWRCAVPENSGALVMRARRPGDRVRTAAGSRKVQDVLVDAKVPRPLRDFVPLVSTGRGSLAVVGLTGSEALRGPPTTVIDVEPAYPSWSKSAAWTA